MGSTLVISGLLFIAAFAVSWWARRQAAQAQAVVLAPEVPISELIQDSRAVTEELGAGSFRMVVRLRGKVVSSHPLVAELSQTPCVSYEFSVTRESEEVLWEVDREGRRVQRVQRRSEVVASNEAATSFELDDGTGRILVHPEHARVERLKTHASFQPGVPGPDTRVGSFSLTMVPYGGGTIGYRYEERALPVGQEVTVIAEAGDLGGQLALRAPEKEGPPFLVSLRSVSDLVNQDRWAVSILRGTSIGLAAVAVVIFLLGVVR